MPSFTLPAAAHTASNEASGAHGVRLNEKPISSGGVLPAPRTALPLRLLMLLGSPRLKSKRSSIVVEVTLTSGSIPCPACADWLAASASAPAMKTCFLILPVLPYRYCQKIKRADCRDGKSALGMRHFVAQ